MAYIDNTTLVNNCDANTSWSPSPSPDADFKVEGANSLGEDVDIETYRTFYDLGATTDYSGRSLYVWMLSFSSPTLDTQAAGGLQICFRDSGSNESYYHVGGVDTYPGGWKCFAASVDVIPDDNNGASAVPSAITHIGVGFKNTAKSKLPENCFWDYIRYSSSGEPVAIVSGGTTGTPLAWEDALTGDQAVTGGFVQSQGASYLLNGPIQIGVTGTNDTYFQDFGSTVFWDAMPVNIDHYSINVSAVAGNDTEFAFGEEVGGQGVGGVIITLNDPTQTWSLRCENNVDTFGIYGCVFQSGSFQGPSGSSAQKALTTTFTDFYLIEPSAMEISFCNIVGSQTASAGVMQLYPAHNTANNNFINTLGALEFMESGVYVVSAIKFYDNTYDIWTDFATTAQATDGANPSITGGTGSVVIQNTVPLEIFNVYTGDEPTDYVRCYIETLTGGPESSGIVLLQDYASAADGGGYYKATAQYNYQGSAQPVLVRARFAGFIPYVTNANIDEDGLSIQAQWVVDPFANI